MMPIDRLPSETATAMPNLDGADRRGGDGLLRRRVEIAVDETQRMRGLVLSDARPAGARILLTSGFGKSIRHSGFLAAHLARCGHEVWRFDFTDHVGDSDGDMLAASLGSAKADLISACRHISAQPGDRPVVIVAASLSARAAIKALADRMVADLAILILPVVNLQSTIRAVTGADLISMARRGRLAASDHIDVLGHPMSGHFVHDAIVGGFDSLAQCRSDFAAFRCPCVIIAAADDEWVDPGDIRAAITDAASGSSVYFVEQNGHDSYSFDFMRLIGNLVAGNVAGALGLPDCQAEPPTFSDFMTTIAADKSMLAPPPDSKGRERDGRTTGVADPNRGGTDR